MEKCVTEMAVLRKLLAKYPIAELGGWTWVLIRSEDWKSVVLPRGISPDSPAFTSIEKRANIEQALVTEVPGRRGELMKTWRMNMEDLLDFAIAHELAHILCNEKDEGEAKHAARMLLEGKPIACKSKPASRLARREGGKNGELAKPPVSDLRVGLARIRSAAYPWRIDIVARLSAM